MFIIFVLIVTDVGIRSIGWQPWLLSSVLVEYGLLWFAMLAAPSLVHAKGHVFIGAITHSPCHPVSSGCWPNWSM